MMIIHYIVPFIAALVTTPLAKRIARIINLIDHPNPDHFGKTHRVPTPLLGGLSILAGILAGIIASGLWSYKIIIFMLCGATMFLLGVLDDRKALEYRLRLAAQIFTALAFVSFKPKEHKECK